MCVDFLFDDVIVVVVIVGMMLIILVDLVFEFVCCCEEVGVWLYVDVVYVGVVVVCLEFWWCFEGCECVDFFVVNLYKWLFMLMDCLVFWMWCFEVLYEMFVFVFEYLVVIDVVVDIKDYGLVFGCCFCFLKFWFVLCWYGVEGLCVLICEYVCLV